jgi:hypothetical protein
VGGSLIFSHHIFETTTKTLLLKFLRRSVQHFFYVAS